jgi:hypothetical protein
VSDEHVYINEGKIVARVGDVVLSPGNVRAIVIGFRGPFVTVLGIGTSKESGDTFVLPQRYVTDVPASECLYLEKQLLNSFPCGPTS